MISLLSIPNGTVTTTAEQISASFVCVVTVACVSSLVTVILVTCVSNLIFNGCSSP